MRFAVFITILAAGTLLAWSPSAWSGPEVRVVVTIKPLHALVSHVMSGVGSPELLVKGTASPHTFSLRPSDIRALNDADLFFRMSDKVEPFSIKVVKSLPKRVEVVTLQDAPGMALLAQRGGAMFERHSHTHTNDSDEDKGQHGHSTLHQGDAVDGHAWLDPHNAKAMVDRIRQVLAAKYPAHAAAFNDNAEALGAQLDKLAAELDGDLQPIADRPYVVFHDALQYFEHRYGLNAVGAISINPEVPPSGKRLTQLRSKIASLGAVCVFAEPSFDTRLIDNLVEGTNARTGTLDPEGARLEPGPNLYQALMRGLAADLKSCLSSPPGQ